MSYPNHITQRLIDDSKEIHRLGGRFEVKSGDWMLWVEEANCPENVISLLIYTIGDGGGGMFYDRKNLYSSMLNNFIPIWDSRKCKKWLRERGWIIDACNDTSYHMVFIIANFEKKRNYKTLAPNEDEACTKAVIKVLREGK